MELIVQYSQLVQVSSSDKYWEYRKIFPSNNYLLDMQINLWYNEAMKEWRWTLIDSEMNMESGGQPDLRLAMNDVANTVEYLIGKE